MSTNGRLVASELTAVQGSIELANDAATDYEAMLHAGMPGSIAVPVGGYRSIAIQQEMEKNPKEFNITPGIALAPVGYSTHGLGECVDIVPAAAVAWVERWGSQFGFSRRASNDPNCFKHAPGVHSTTTASTGSSTLLTDPNESDDTMYYTVTGDSSDKLILNGWGYVQVGNGPVTALTNLEALFVPATAWKTINGNDLRYIAAHVGFAEHGVIGTPPPLSSNGVPLFGPGKLTGRLIFDGGSTPVYPTTVPSTAVSGGTTSIQPVLDALAALDKQDDAYQSALIAALTGLPAAIRAKIIAAP